MKTFARNKTQGRICQMVAKSFEKRRIWIYVSILISISSGVGRCNSTTGSEPITAIIRGKVSSSDIENIIIDQFNDNPYSIEQNQFSTIIDSMSNFFLKSLLNVFQLEEFL